MDYYKAQSAGKTSLVVTHDPAEASQLSKKILRIMHEDFE
jgi:ABC-type nitrate/sulfonate/bicarbonate transport system ATPase subunit